MGHEGQYVQYSCSVYFRFTLIAEQSDVTLVSVVD